MNNIYKYNISSLLLIGLAFILINCNDINVKPDMSMGFKKDFGGTKASFVSEVQLASDGGYIFVGTTGNTNGSGGSNESGGVTDIYVVKTDLNGNLLWEKRFGSAGADTGVSIKQTSDNGFIVLGTVSNDLDGTSMYLCKLDNGGAMKWHKTIGNFTSGGYIEVTSDGGFIILGNTDSAGVDLEGPNKVFLFRTDAEGNKLFQIDPSGFNANNISATAVVQVNDTTFDWIGTSDVSPVIARNRQGGSGVLFAYQKDQDFISETSILSYEALRKTSDGGYILTGTCINNNNDLQAFLMKLTGDLKESPQKAWFKTYGGTKDEESYSVVETTDGGFILTGYTDSYGNGNEDIYMVKTDANGDQQWSKTFGGTSYDTGISIKQTKDGGYIIASNFSLITTPLDNVVISLMKTDANGEIKNTK